MEEDISDSVGDSAGVSASVGVRALTGTQPRLAYRVFGDHGAPVLFAMGYGMPGGVWGPQVDELRKDHRCCHYDHLGVGGSERGPLFPTMRSMAGDALRIMDDLSWDRAHIVGVSMGGMIAQEIALWSPDRCRTLTLIATHGGAPAASLPTLEGTWLFLHGLFGGQQARVRSLPRLLYPDEYLKEIDRAAFDAHMGERLGKPASLRTVIGQLLAVWRHRTESRLAQIELPTLLVRPGKDILIRPKQTDRLAKRIPHAEVLRFDDAGHGVTFQKAAQLNAALRQHFQRS